MGSGTSKWATDTLPLERVIMSLLEDLRNGPIGQIMGNHGNLVGATFQIIHIVGLVSLLTGVLLIALRLLNTGLKYQTTEEVLQLARPFIWLGLSATVVSGVVMFASNAVAYAAHPALQLKLVLLLLATIVQVVLFRYVVSNKLPNRFAVGAALALLVLWFGTGLAGRAIGFI